MIFRRLIMTNFRVFDGEHTVDLQPRKEGLLASPVVLFGGLNGAGKTTILTAIRLALLGRRAVGKTLKSADYNQYLAEQINATARAKSEDSVAKIALEFTHTHEGKHHCYLVTRQWTHTGDERLTIHQNNVFREELNSDQVQTILSEIVPPGIGDLFFYDGEKIAELAEDDTGQYLKEAVQKLLGIDVVNRLSHDLDIYLKQLSKDSADKSVLQKITELENEKKDFYKKAEMAREKAYQIAPELSDVRKRIAKIETTIQERGGAWATTREAEKAKLNGLLKDKELIERDILKELDSAFPLSLAPTALANLISQLEQDKKVKEKSILYNNLEAFSQAITNELADSLSIENSSVAAAIANATQKLKSDSPAQKPIFDISDSDFYTLKALEVDAKKSKQNVIEFSEKLSKTSNDLELLSLNIQRAPDEEELTKLYENLRALDKEQMALKGRYVENLKDAKAHMSKAVEFAKRLEKLFNQQKNETTIVKAESRIDGTKQVLDRFSDELTLLRVEQLEELFAKSYRKLARKEDLKLAAKIDPNTFDVTLVDNEGIAINRKSLSAGEKQIFAFAILEALGKLSGKVLPVVIDTPLGRLDSKHRDKLVNHYFPEAGEQVILLSTDTEVDAEFYESLSSNISHSYQVEFDDKTRCSRITKGYFWQTLQKEAV